MLDALVEQLRLFEKRGWEDDKINETKKMLMQASICDELYHSPLQTLHGVFIFFKLEGELRQKLTSRSKPLTN